MCVDFNEDFCVPLGVPAGMHGGQAMYVLVLPVNACGEFQSCNT